MTCERCGQRFQVKRREEADQCVYHWGRPFVSKANGLLLFRSLERSSLTSIHRRCSRRVKTSV